MHIAPMLADPGEFVLDILASFHSRKVNRFLLMYLDERQIKLHISLEFKKILFLVVVIRFA